MIITYYNSTVPGPCAPQFKKLITAFEITFLKNNENSWVNFPNCYTLWDYENSKKWILEIPKLIPTAWYRSGTVLIQHSRDIRDKPTSPQDAHYHFIIDRSQGVGRKYGNTLKYISHGIHIKLIKSLTGVKIPFSTHFSTVYILYWAGGGGGKDDPQWVRRKSYMRAQVNLRIKIKEFSC